MSLARLRGGLIVSCQARAGHPLRETRVIVALARSAVAGGAAGLRLNGEEDIRAARQAVGAVPIIGIRKVWTAGMPVYITPSFADAAVVAAAGADIVALDATARPRAGEPLEQLLPRIRAELGRPVMADVATVEEGDRAASLGADLVATTLAGYTGTAPPPAEPDLALLRELCRTLRVPVVAEGRYHTPEQVREAFRAGAYAVVVGRAITDALFLTRRFVDALQRGAP
jgi:N-acylglucosamine-6-phosphate 2-epimerase